MNRSKERKWDWRQGKWAYRIYHINEGRRFWINESTSDEIGNPLKQTQIIRFEKEQKWFSIRHAILQLVINVIAWIHISTQCIRHQLLSTQELSNHFQLTCFPKRLKLDDPMKLGSNPTSRDQGLSSIIPKNEHNTKINVREARAKNHFPSKTENQKIESHSFIIRSPAHECIAFETS